MFRASVWLRFIRLKVFYWRSLCCILYKLFTTQGTERDRHQMHLVVVIAKLDILSIYATLQELLIVPPY